MLNVSVFVLLERLRDGDFPPTGLLSHACSGQGCAELSLGAGAQAVSPTGAAGAQVLEPSPGASHGVSAGSWTQERGWYLNPGTQLCGSSLVASLTAGQDARTSISFFEMTCTFCAVVIPTAASCVVLLHWMPHPLVQFLPFPAASSSSLTPWQAEGVALAPVTCHLCGRSRWGPRLLALV